MSRTIALLVGVSEYTKIKANPLPLCKNDIRALNDALIKGLNLNPSDIIICGHNVVTHDEFVRSLQFLTYNVDREDTLIFYFSGHGFKQDGKNYLVLSNAFIEIQELINLIDKVHAKNNVIILDSCYSGNSSLESNEQIDIDETIEQFVGHGFAIMASCGSDETSGFHNTRGISLYTSFVCDALNNKYITKKGKKSLEDIRQYIDRLAIISNQKSTNGTQHVIFRSNIGGTIYFDVDKYKPYEVDKIYKEKDKYIIYDVQPTHANIKRMSIKVILRFPSTMEEIAKITNEIKDEAIYYDVYQNEKEESRFKGMPTKIVWCYFGYDETDIVNSNFAYKSIWVDDTLDKNYWYSISKNSEIINEIKVEEISYYNSMKKFTAENIASDDELIEATRKCVHNMIIYAEKFIILFREYLNNTISEDELIEKTTPINHEIKKLYTQETNLPIASNELHNWQLSYSMISGTIHDFTLYYDKNSKWDSNNRVILTELTLKRYNEELEIIKEIDQQLKI